MRDNIAMEDDLLIDFNIVASRTENVEGMKRLVITLLENEKVANAYITRKGLHVRWKR